MPDEILAPKETIQLGQAELQRPGTVAWHRNPARASQNSLGVTYHTGSAISVVRSDFIFLRQSDGNIAVYIVDPHGLRFADALPRLAGLARYAEKHSTVYRRIEVVAQIGRELRAIDLIESLG